MIFSTLRSVALRCATLILLTHCSKKEGTDNTPSPVANFTYTTVGGGSRAPVTVQFSNTSLNAASYSWNFGDGSPTSTSREPTYKYGRAGTYTVLLKATVGGKSSTKTETLTVLPAYTALKLTNVLFTTANQASTFTGYLEIRDAAGRSYFTSGTMQVDPATFPINYLLNPAPVLSDLNQTYSVELWKKGPFSDTRVVASPLIPVLYTTGDNTANSYPLRIPGTGGVSFHVQWQ